MGEELNAWIKRGPEGRCIDAGIDVKENGVVSGADSVGEPSHLWGLAVGENEVGYTHGIGIQIHVQ
jgi:hypothetical protein